MNDLSIGIFNKDYTHSANVQQNLVYNKHIVSKGFNMSYIQESVAIEPRAGLVPFIHDEDGKIRYLTMISSSPRFGGPRPMISKGKVEDNESTLEAAFREAEEELGFKLSNVAGLSTKIADEHVTLRSTNYHLTLYSVEVLSKYDFTKWGDETSCTVWLTLDEFRHRGRSDHIEFIERIERKEKSK